MACALLISVTSLAAAADGTRAEGSDGEVPPEPRAQLNLGPPAPDSPFASPVAQQFERLDPLKDGWSTEAIADAASSQLKQLGKLLAHPAEVDEQRLSAMVDADVEFHPLRPGALREAYTDATVTVRRAAEEADAGERQPLQGRAALAGALRELLNDFDPNAEVRVEFKTFQVQAAQDTATTSAFFHATGTASRGRLQQNATWYCTWRLPAEGQPPLLVGVDVKSFEEVALHQGLDRLFADCTAAVLGGNASFQEQLIFGIDHWRARIEKSWGIEVTGYQGMALGDINGDGLDDLYVLQPGGLPNRLYQQNPDGTATDVSVTAGVDWLDRSNGALFADLDNDGDQDLIVATDYQLLFMANDGQGRFATKVSQRTHAIPRSLCAADYDLDGDLDVYVCYASPEVVIWERESSLPMPIHDANNGAASILYRSDGNWTFRDVTAEVGLDENNRRFSWAAAWEDFDNDGDQDLYVANDFGRNNLYRNDGGRFVDVAPQAAVEDSSAGMSVSWADYDRDGWMDLYVGNMFSAAGNRIAYQRQFQTGLDDDARRTIQRHARGNSLFKNSGQGGFYDVSEAAAVTMGRWAWGSLFADINNDGWEDLLVANGYVTQAPAQDL